MLFSGMFPSRRDAPEVLVSQPDREPEREFSGSRYEGRCEDCGRVYKHLEVHQRNVCRRSKDATFSCADCGKVYIHMTSLQFHRKHGCGNKANRTNAHSNPGVFPCDYCGKIFSYLHNMRVHQKKRCGKTGELRRVSNNM